MKQSVPQSLKKLFFVHFVLDFIFAIPLIFFPVWFTSLFGLVIIEPLFARLVGAALIGVGGVSFFVQKKSLAEYSILLTLKLLWSTAAILGIIISLFNNYSLSVVTILLIFIIFNLLWLYYKFNVLKQNNL